MIYHIILGANLQEPKAMIHKAQELIAEIPEVRILRESSLIQTKPYGYVHQNDFYNQVLELDTPLEPRVLLARLLDIESTMGRIRFVKWGPRLIDIDILLAEDTVIQEANITIPHPDFHNRDFALELLCELVPDAVHPVFHKTMTELYKALPDTGGNT